MEEGREGQVEEFQEMLNFKHLTVLLTQQSGKFQAAESLENCALRYRSKAVDVVNSSKAAQVCALVCGVESRVDDTVLPLF